MDHWKPWFMAPYMLLTMIAVIHSLGLLVVQGSLRWAAPLIACLPLLVLMGWFVFAGQARSSANLPGVLIPALVGGLLSIVAALSASGMDRLLLLFYGPVVGAGGACLYIFWYSKLPRDTEPLLRAGQPIPEIQLRSLSGKELSTPDLVTTPALWLFYRGNWCPLCMAQIREVAERYRELESRGVRLLLISPQPESQSRELAEKHSVNFEFLVDPEGRCAKALGIYHEGGLPKGMGMEKRGYQPDTVLPTVVITDGEGFIVWIDQTDNYRVRPEPDTFIDIIDRYLGGQVAGPAAT